MNDQCPKYLFTVILLFGISQLSAQNVIPDKDNYKLVQNILYHDTTSKSIDPYKLERCRLDLYYPSNKTKFKTVVWFHGGGLRGGEKSIPDELKNNDIAFAAINYRLFPNVECPAYIEDAAASIAWVFKHIEEFGGSSDKIYLSGHSAGGYLVSMVGLDKKWLSKYGIDADSIAGLIPFSGHTITHFTVREERGIPGEQPITDEFAPLFHVRDNAPPLILITGDRELELLGRYEENALLMRMMKVAGHTKTKLYELQGFDHVGMLKPAFLILNNYLHDSLEIN